MATYFAGSEPEIFDTFTGTVSTDSRIAVSGENRSGFFFTSASSGSVGSFSSSVSEAYVHFKFLRSGTIGSATSYTVFRLRNPENQTLFSGLVYLANTNLTIIGPNSVQTTIAADPVINLDVYYKIDPTSGIFRIWSNQILVYNFSGSVQFPSGTQSANNIIVSGMDSASRIPYFSQFLVSDKNTVGAKVYTLPLTQESSSWSGNTSNVIGTSVATLANSISSNIANANVIFTVTDLAALSNTQYIDSLVLSTRALSELGSITNTLTSFVRTTSNTDIIGNSLPLITTFTTEQFIYNENPETSLAWTRSETNNVLFGLIIKTS